MSKKNLAFIVVIVMFSFLIGCKYTNNKIELYDDNEVKSEEIYEPEKKQIEEIDPIKEQIKKMTLEEKIGQMVIVGFNGYTMNEDISKMIEKYHIGGFILFKRNVKDSNQLLNLINSLKQENRVNKLPLFISVDEEGGRVSRMPDEFVNLPTNKDIGQINNNDFSFEIGSIIAKQLSAFGFNMNFAPVLDINSNPKNPVIGDRSFGCDKQIVSELGVQTMKGIQSGNVISVVKHFPGHGDTSIDSHIGLPCVNNDLDRLNSFELIPFKAAIKNDADGIMIAHILLPKIDSENPASLSKTIITDILRNELNFDGVVITDDMTMGAVAKNYDIKDAAVKSVNAGSDIILVCHEYNNQIIVINGLKEAAKNGTLQESKVDNSVYRILKLKQKYNLSNEMISSVNVKEINDRIDNNKNTIK